MVYEGERKFQVRRNWSPNTIWIVDVHLYQGDDVGTSSGDAHVTHVSPPSGGEGCHVSPLSGPVYDTVSQPSYKRTCLCCIIIMYLNMYQLT